MDYKEAWDVLEDKLCQWFAETLLNDENVNVMNTIGKVLQEMNKIMLEVEDGQEQEVLHGCIMRNRTPAKHNQ